MHSSLPFLGALFSLACPGVTTVLWILECLYVSPLNSHSYAVGSKLSSPPYQALCRA